MTDNTNELQAKIWKHVGAIRTCMMTTHDGKAMHSRPMAGMARSEEQAIWFYADRTAHKDEEISRDPTACLAYADTHANTYVSLAGNIDIVDDRALIHEMWNEGVGMYFPNGPDDPNIVLLRFHPDSAEYWDSTSSNVVMAIKFVQSKLTGKRPDMGENATVSMSDTE